MDAMNSMKESYAIEMRHVTKAYPPFVLEDLSLCLPSGCIMGLIGENGAGKSTTIGLLMNTVRKDSGEILVLGRDNASKDFRQVKEEIGVVLDEAYFPEVLNVKNVDEIMKRTYKSWDEGCFYSYAGRFGLPEKKIFKEYSRGMKMKLSIAVALSHRSRLLLLDEATSGLDPMVRDEILEIFNDFTRQEDHSILISSHIISDLEKICDYIAFLHQGRLLFCEEKDRLLEKYGILRVPKSALSKVPREAVAARKEYGYGEELLVLRERLSPAFEVEPADIEEIMLLCAAAPREEGVSPGEAAAPREEGVSPGEAAAPREEGVSLGEAAAPREEGVSLGEAASQKEDMPLGVAAVLKEENVSQEGNILPGKTIASRQERMPPDTTVSPRDERGGKS